MIIIFSAPSGSGKSTIVNYLLSRHPELEFSVSATSRAPRGTEKHGEAYYFLTTEEFKKKIAENAFVEYEEVYSGCYYGTLKSEIERISAKGHHVVFDVDVVGGCNLKRIFGKEALSIFIAPPSVEVLRQRLKGRGTDSDEMIEKRVDKAEYEMTFAPKFDKIIVNDRLEDAQQEAEAAILQFIHPKA
ncbi:MAG: guanylate kinase [Bacteroidetes bacterium]|uniref:Guanylate kinase n=1 Tax=Candidatus Gallipaludibacter merdavium TaxID=2840839 RepID=A0A9D9N4M4_9BACT|nr:guanylate kinase [Candidatus Gallipaludibacter merdavium]